MRRLYFDHNAGSPMPLQVREILASALERFEANPSSPHAGGQAARLALEEARNTVAEIAGARPGEVIFTSGGTESNNAALRGVALGMPVAGEARAPHVVTTAVEHPSILETCRALASLGVEVSLLPVDSSGLADPDDLARLLDERHATLVSVMHANNETGVIQPVEEMARAARERGVPFHCDAVQSAGKVPLQPLWATADLLSLASHKVGGPAGIGALIVREATPFAASLTGGAQEGRRRAGTEPVALAVAFAEALRLGEARAASGAVRITRLRDRIEAAVPVLDLDAVIHGKEAPRLPNTTNVFFPGAPGRMLVMQLDLLGYSVSTGSACSTGSSRPSHVLAAMGRPRSETLDSLRISLGPQTSDGEVEGLLGALTEAVSRLAASPPDPGALGAAVAAGGAR